MALRDALFAHPDYARIVRYLGLDQEVADLDEESEVATDCLKLVESAFVLYDKLVDTFDNERDIAAFWQRVGQQCNVWYWG